MRDSEMVKDPLERMQPATRTIVLLLEPLKPYNITIQGFICWAFRLHECAGLKNAQLFFARRTPKLTRYATLIDEQTETAGEFPAHNPNRRSLRATGADFVPTIAIGLFAGLRPEAELWHLDWKSINLANKLIDVTKSKNSDLPPFRQNQR
jgi:hypothetical protein